MSFIQNKAIVDNAKSAYFGLAIGDALGATVEFMLPREIKQQYGVHKKIIGGGWLKLKPGEVTDDTEMSLALGDALLSNCKVDAVIIAEAFDQWMRSKPVDIGNTVRRGILNYRNHGETAVMPSENNAGNGACMRTLPIAIATLGNDSDEINMASRIHCHITHNSTVADQGTEHVIALIQAALTNAPKFELKNMTDAFVTKNPLYRYEGKKINNPGGYLVETLQAVFQSFYSTDNFESCMIDVVNRGGDADTTGAITGMIAGAYYGLDSIPKFWLRKLNYDVMMQCAEQANNLLKLAPISMAIEAESYSPWCRTN